jgi:hypothetical protein
MKPRLGFHRRQNTSTANTCTHPKPNFTLRVYKMNRERECVCCVCHKKEKKEEKFHNHNTTQRDVFTQTCTTFPSYLTMIALYTYHTHIYSFQKKNIINYNTHTPVFHPSRHNTFLAWFHSESNCS